MDVLTDREAKVIEMRFGLSDGIQMTLEQIGQKFNVSRERIRQIEARALSKMRLPVVTGKGQENSISSEQFLNAHMAHRQYTQ